MHDIIVLFQYQGISEEIRGYVVQLDVCLRMFSVGPSVILPITRVPLRYNLVRIRRRPDAVDRRVLCCPTCRAQ